jgi:uncharacterized protein (UPF0276 family)
MDFAINYSPQAAQLLKAHKIDVDYFKTPPWPDMITKAQQDRPVSVHFELRAGSGKLHKTDWEFVETYLDSTATKYVNLHLAADIRDGLPFETDNPSPIEIEEVLANMHHDTAAAVARFGPEKVIVENVPYRVGEKHVVRTCTQPEVISEIITSHRCGLLLDISHARISADALGMDPQIYIQALPVDHLKELHFTGLHDLGDNHLMDHLPILDTDWPWLEWVLNQIKTNSWGKPHMLALEYGGDGNAFFEANSDINVIERDVSRLYALCHT